MTNIRYGSSRRGVLVVHFVVGFTNSLATSRFKLVAIVVLVCLCAFVFVLLCVHVCFPVCGVSSTGTGVLAVLVLAGWSLMGIIIGLADRAHAPEPIIWRNLCRCQNTNTITARILVDESKVATLCAWTNVSVIGLRLSRMKPIRARPKETSSL